MKTLDLGKGSENTELPLPFKPGNCWLQDSDTIIVSNTSLRSPHFFFTQLYSGTGNFNRYTRFVVDSLFLSYPISSLFATNCSLSKPYRSSYQRKICCKRILLEYTVQHYKKLNKLLNKYLIHFWYLTL